MNRRELLEWVSRGLATGVTALIGLPGFKYILGTVEQKSASQSQFSRLIRLKDLIPGRPTIIPVMGQKKDAWIQSDQQALGRVWLVRASGDSVETTSGEKPVRALSSVCPHMGCQLQSAAGGKNFVCPCHRATFDADGHRLSDPKTGEQNHAPRDMDELECRVVQDDGGEWLEVKYEKFKTGLDHRVAGV
jgi:menaquinol-cytochrome c reductase iron-sulfur subunit